MKDLEIGKLITMEVPRDAIHIAVAPVTTESNLRPGQPIRFMLVGNVEMVESCSMKEAVGIVDPFLESPIPIGSSFWMFLKPNTITSLRHEWAHPAFDGNEKGIAEFWMRDFAQTMNAPYDEIMEGAKRGEITLGHDLDYGHVREEELRKFWHYFEVLTGIKKDDHTDQIFRCAC